MPAAFDAATANVYVVLYVRPVKVVDVRVDVAYWLNVLLLVSVAVIVYVVIGDPPVSVGAVQVTVAEVDDAEMDAVPIVGVPGVV